MTKLKILQQKISLIYEIHFPFNHLQNNDNLKKFVINETTANSHFLASHMINFPCIQYILVCIHLPSCDTYYTKEPHLDSCCSISVPLYIQLCLKFMNCFCPQNLIIEFIPSHYISVWKTAFLEVSSACTPFSVSYNVLFNHLHSLSLNLYQSSPFSLGYNIHVQRLCLFSASFLPMLPIPVLSIFFHMVDCLVLLVFLLLF